MNRCEAESAAGRPASVLIVDDTPANLKILAAMLQRTPLEARWPIVSALAQRAEDAEDPNLPPMLWYGTEPLITSDLAKSAALAAECKIPFLRTSIARRIASGK